MIKIQTARPYGTYSSKKSIGFADFPNSVNAARIKIKSEIRMSGLIDRNRNSSKVDYVYLYEIIKLNVKKKNTKKNY